MEANRKQDFRNLKNMCTEYYRKHAEFLKAQAELLKAEALIKLHTITAQKTEKGKFVNQGEIENILI